MSISAEHQLIRQVAQVLYQHDPMNTGCSVNEGMEDEYLGQAKDIVRQVSAGMSLREALVSTFDHWFWEGCLLEAHRKPSLDNLLAALRNVVKEKSS